MANFKTLKIWELGIGISMACYDLAALLPREERYGLYTQMTRSAVSIPSNIAEGSSRSSEKDFARILEIALGSAFELETQAIIAVKQKFLPMDVVNVFLKSLNEEQRMIYGLISKLREG